MDNLRPTPPLPSAGLFRQSTSSHPRLTLEERPILWAVDAFPADADFQLQMAHALCALLRFAPQTPVQPVYILSEESFSERGFSSFLRPALKPMALKSLRTLLSSVSELNLRRPRVLIESSASRTACARKLLRYSARIGATLVALSTHARPRLSRFFNGSFSDEIFRHCQLPVYALGPEAAPLVVDAPKTIVLPTDFARSGMAAYDEILSLAASLNARVHLFHKSLHSIDPVVQTGANLFAGGWIPLDAHMAVDFESFAIEAEEWQRRAHERGVEVRYIRENLHQSTAEAIVSYVKSLIELEKDSTPLLAFSHQTKKGALADAIFGSVRRDVIRASPCPVYMASQSS